MDWLETQIRRQVAGRALTQQSERVLNFPATASGSSSGHAEAVSDLVSEVAEAIKAAEERAAETVARAESIANNAAEKLRLGQLRAERAEAAQRKSGAELAEFRDEVEKARSELEHAQAQLAFKAGELAEAEQRAEAAARRADDAEADLERVMHALRTQLARKEASPASAKGS
jgi:chromosome segregation ATPase